MKMQVTVVSKEVLPVLTELKHVCPSLQLFWCFHSKGRFLAFFSVIIISWTFKFFITCQTCIWL